MSRKKDYRDMYNNGSELEIEALFIKKWCELKQLLYSKLVTKAKPTRGLADPDFKGWK